MRNAFLLMSEQLFCQLNAFAVDVFQWSYTELFPEPSKEMVAAQIGLAAKIVDQDLVC